MQSQNNKWKGKLCPCSKPAKMWKLHAPCCEECSEALNKYYIHLDRKDKGVKRKPVGVNIY